jgi:leukotriene-A4 hydrolase
MQDTPAVKMTYSAKVTVKNDFVVHMSANSTGVDQLNSTHKMYKFENNIKMPTYLIAIAVGDLEYRFIGNRTGIITEPSNVEAVAKELASLPELLEKAEAYLTPYIWGNYSILVLPPSFPMGGMENPLLTFASPTIITGDGSQVYVATHEIAHSWTGNDVTCENWSNLWLNEGFTVFEERKVSAQIHGVDFSKVNAYLGNISMYQDMVGYGLNHTYASLYPVVDEDKPDNSFSEIPYEKGFQLLYYLESLLGEKDMQSLI